MTQTGSALEVIDSFYTVSGRVFSALHCCGGKLDNNTVVSAMEGKKWRVIDNSVTFGHGPTLDMLKSKEKEFIFF